jgi:cytochrome c556
MKSIRVAIATLLMLAGACNKVGAPAVDLLRTATIKDIMDSMVDPSGDFLFESIVVIADENGITEKAPRTDDEWEQVRHHAIILLEAPNLLTMDGRRVARSGEKAQNPEVELHPEDIQKLVDGDRPSFIRRARKLQDAAALALKAIEAKDTDELFQAIESIDKACENCHLHYWYPNDKRAQEAAKEQGIVD